MKWNLEYFEEARKDLLKLDRSQQLLVLKAIEKVQSNPLPATEGGYGKPLGNHNKTRLAGLLKIKLKSSGLRVVYQIIQNKHLMQIIIISIRDHDEVYKVAEQRIQSYEN